MLGELAHDRRQAELLERRDVALHAPQHEADRAALAHHVDAEAADARHRVREVGFARRDELLGALLRHDRERDALGLDRRHRRVVDALEAAVDADERRRAHLDVDVGRAALDGVGEQLIEIQHAGDPPLADRSSPPIGSARKPPGLKREAPPDAGNSGDSGPVLTPVAARRRAYARSR